MAYDKIVILSSVPNQQRQRQESKAEGTFPSTTPSGTPAGRNKTKKHHVYREYTAMEVFVGKCESISTLIFICIEKEVELYVNKVEEMCTLFFLGMQAYLLITDTKVIVQQ